MVICGEDSVASRNYFFELKKKYQAKDIEVQEINPNQIEEINNWLGDSLSLFSTKKIFFTQVLNKTISRKTSIKRVIENLIKSKEVEIVDWEEGVSTRELKFSKLASVKEFKPTGSIFKLIDSCYPGNLSIFINQLNNLPDKIEAGFIFFMLSKQIRNLLLVKSDEQPAKMMDWQIWKLKKQANFWSQEKLLSFYEGLHRIDILVKTSQNPFSLRHSLDILAYYIL